MATFTALSLDFKTLLSTTLMKVLGTNAIRDNVFDANPLLSWLRGGDRIRVIDGGERIRIPIMTGKNSTVGSYDNYDLIDTTAQEGVTTAFFNWKQYAGTVSVSGKELRSNAGSKEKISDIQSTKIDQASMSIQDTVSTDVYTDGTGNGSKNITGLAAMNETTPGTTAYAEVPTANTVWVNQSVASVGAAAVNLVPQLRVLMNDCSQGKNAAATKPDFAVTTQSIHESLEALIFPMVRYAPNPSGGADAGIESLRFKGAEIQWSDYCTSGELHVLNSNHTTLFVHRDANFSMAEGGFQRPVNQDAFLTQILVQLNLATDNRRKGGKLAGIT